MKAWLLVGVLLVVVVVAVVVGAVLVYEDAFGTERDYYRQAKVGMEESTILNMFGEPQKVIWGETAPDEYYVPGYSYESRDVSKKLLIYFGSEAIAYIYIGDDDKVECVFVGGS